METERIIELADNILSNKDISQKRNGIANLMNKIWNDISIVIPFLKNNMPDFHQWRYANYKDEIFMGYIGDSKKKMIKYVDEHFTEIMQYEEDCEEVLELRKKKLEEYAQVVNIPPKIKSVVQHIGVRNDTEIEYEPEADRIYTQHGIYRRYWNYKKSPYFRFALDLRNFLDRNSHNFIDLCKKVFLYISLKNELRQINEEMELLGLCTEEKESDSSSLSINGYSHKKNGSNIIKEDELRGYFTLAFKGGGNGKIDYFTKNLLPDLKQRRTDKDFAKIAFLIYESKKLIPSMCPQTFKEWYQKFCELVGCKFHKDYKPSNLQPDDKFKKAFYYLQV